MLGWIRELHARLGARRRHAKYLARWRAVNAHNEVVPVGHVDPDMVSIGKRSYGELRVSAFGTPGESLSIGHYVSIAPGVRFLLGGNHPVDGLSTFPFRVKLRGDAWEGTTKGPIVVGDDVWIGTDSLILSGVTIGQGAVVAARSVVTRDVPPYTIVGGNPARVIKRRFSEAITARLLTLDFSTLDEAKVVDNIDRIYASLTEDSVDEVMGLVVRQLR